MGRNFRRNPFNFLLIANKTGRCSSISRQNLYCTNAIVPLRKVRIKTFCSAIIAFDYSRSVMIDLSNMNSQPIRASIPADTRIYAIGDIHGRADLLYEITQRIEDDLRRRPIKYAIEIYLGDYIDRGPDSKDVIDQLAVRLIEKRGLCLRGNHEALLAEFLQDPSVIYHWSQIGAWETFASYGVSVGDGTITPADLHRSFLKVFPRAHELFLQCLRDSFCCGDYVFVHAGIRPGIPIELQDTTDLHWIRSEFLESTQSHGKYVVHGHTPVNHADIRSNRINIDTGAWVSGVLTCIAIEGETLLVL